MTPRGVKFVLVGAAGFVLQLGVLAALTLVLRVAWEWATIVAVECAILHNFGWHQRWTWHDRTNMRSIARLARFHAGAAATSIGGNLAVMSVLMGAGGLGPIPANAIAVVVVSVLNYVLADRWVFGSTSAAAMTALAILSSPTNASAEPPPQALRSWSEVVASIESTGKSALHSGTQRDARQNPGFKNEITTEGESVDVDGGTISRWRGAVFIPGITVDRLLNRLQYPGIPPPQEDIVSARVIGRGRDFVRVYMRLVRRAIVPVTYDTEHDMSFQRLSSTSAIARSVATKIEEAGGARPQRATADQARCRSDREPRGQGIDDEDAHRLRDHMKRTRDDRRSRTQGRTSAEGGRRMSGHARNQSDRDLNHRGSALRGLDASERCRLGERDADRLAGKAVRDGRAAA